jgi:hypothetical protein
MLTIAGRARATTLGMLQALGGDANAVPPCMVSSPTQEATQTVVHNLQARNVMLVSPVSGMLAKPFDRTDVAHRAYHPLPRDEAIASRRSAGTAGGTLVAGTGGVFSRSMINCGFSRRSTPSRRHSEYPPKPEASPAGMEQWERYQETMSKRPLQSAGWTSPAHQMRPAHYRRRDADQWAIIRASDGSPASLARDVLLTVKTDCDGVIHQVGVVPTEIGRLRDGPALRQFAERARSWTRIVHIYHGRQRYWVSREPSLFT